ncbi:MAG TPA: amino acid adenylation domain-containing protein, partial [Longimicrobiaceae bacterium]
VSLVRLEDREHALLVNMHHIVSDAWSIDVMVREVAELYDAAREGRSPRLPPLPVQYADFAAWQRGWLQGEELERQLAWWRERLAGAATLELPTDRPRPRVAGSAGRTVQLRLPRETGVALRALSRSEGATPFMTLMAAWQALLGRHAGQEDVSVGTPIAGRNRKEIEGLIGFFVNTLVIRADLSGRPDARELVRRVRATTLGAYQQQDIPFEKLVDEMGVERSLSHSPLFQALFAMRTLDGGGPRLGGAVLERVSTGGTTAKFDLTLSVSDDGRDMGGSLEFRTDLFDTGTAERLAERFVVLLRGMTGSPETPVAALPLMAEGERQRVLAEWNAAGAEAPPSGGGALHERFEAQARRTPDAVAVEGGGERATYAELDARSARLARRLRARGVGPESRVGVWLERTPELVVALLAVLKAGAAYVPLEMSYPPDRIAFMLEDAGVSVLLTQERLLGRLPAHAAEAVFVDAEQGGEDPGGPLPPAEVSPGSLAYLIYTSGSTGRPKGVAMPQRPLLQLLDWQARDWSGPAAARTLQFAAASFDVSFQEIFSTLLSGGTLLLVPEELRTDLPGLARHLDEARVERLFLPFVALQHLAKSAEEQGIAPAALREVVTAGEQLQVTESIRGWLGRIPGCVLVNQYGPSETHVATSHTLPGGAEEWPALPPIGRPIAGTRCYVLDAELEPVPIGVPGELFLGGAGVARGYHGRAELTAERFLPDPFPERPGARTYRTGDRARWLADGTLEFLGRTDQQAKIRGFRVEPGEVETALRAHPGLRDAVVAVREDTPGNRRLVAYLVPHPGAETPRPAALRTFLRARLPEYMVPAAFVPLEALPTTPSGKTDRAALPAPDRRAAGEEYVVPRNPTEEALAAVWAEVLGIERVGANDNFFDLGGHSLLVVQLHSRLRERLAPDLTVADLFGVRTLADLARQIDEAREAAEQAGEEAPRGDAQPRAGALRARRGRERALRAPREDEDDAGDE